MSNYLLSYPVNFCYDPAKHRQDIEVSMGGYFFCVTLYTHIQSVGEVLIPFI